MEILKLRKELINYIDIWDKEDEDYEQKTHTAERAVELIDELYDQLVSLGFI